MSVACSEGSKPLPDCGETRCYLGFGPPTRDQPIWCLAEVRVTDISK